MMGDKEKIEGLTYEQKRGILKRQKRKENRKRFNEAYIRGEVVFYRPRLIWTEGKCLEVVNTFIAEGKSTQDLRKEHIRCYEVIYDRYRYMLSKFPGYVSYEERCKNGDSRSSRKDRIMRKEIRSFEGSKEEFDKQYNDKMEYIMNRKDLKKAYESHFRCHPKKPTLSQIQRDMKGYKQRDEKGMYRAIYVYTFEGNETHERMAYVGLTKDLAKRYREHNGISRFRTDPIAYHKYVNGIEFEYKVLTEFIPEEEAQQEEMKWEREYKKRGYKMLNVATCGSLGGNLSYNIK